MLNKISLTRKLLTLTVIPLVAAILFAVILISKENKSSRSAEQVSQLMYLAVVNSQFVHELQKERGLTAAFYGSGGDATFKRRLAEQRQLSDAKKTIKLNKAKELIELITELGLTEVNNKNSQTISQLATVRSQVDNQSISVADAIGYYTNLNAALLSVVSTVAKQASSADIKQQGLAYYNFVQAKERAGIERAVMSNVFGQNTISLPVYLRFKELVLLQNTYLSEFENLATDDMLAFYQQASKVAAVTEVNRYRAIAEQNNINGQFNVSSGDWFNSATARY